MSETRTEEYRGWTIELRPGQGRLCSEYAMTLRGPEGEEKNVPLAGDTAERALSRGREYIDVEEDIRQRVAEKKARRPGG
ncbi:hypothetical protein [Desulfohalovibrio reitneri]|uniref:hypothetical protein n=1 Tax=Desulfohalovibrio reitneri TaxID=1307759 RepID=UPI0004A72BEF|nr:hypothetical protein [Desulfohalovibrio reitneri]